MEVALRRREQEVWQACDDLWAVHGDVKHLTGDAIRERLLVLGKSRGSPNEIYKYRKSWSSSRRIDNNIGQEHFEDTDPISRAVRMVHEKLLGEADEKIEILQNNFETQIREKEQELEKKHADLSQVILELGYANTQNAKTLDELKELEQLLVAETEVRKALERELTHVKTSHEKILEELKAAHKNMCEHLAQIYQTQEKDRLEHISRLQAEKKELGFEFSEKLTEIKTQNYGQTLIIKNLQADLKAQATLLEEKAQWTQSQESKQKIMLEEYSNLASINRALTAKIDYLDAAHAQSQREHRQVLITNKKNELTIARLRAMQAFAGEHDGTGVAVKKRPAQGPIISSPRSTQGASSNISVQNPCSQ